MSGARGAWGSSLRRWWYGPAVIVVSGLPRSGTSMMMRMLEAGGIAPLSDGIRPPDADNPNGYYEEERVKALDESGDKRWVRDARGRALKVISHLLRHLPRDHVYDVILMRRDLDEVVASQNRMLERRGEPNPLGDRETQARFEQHLEGVRRWLERDPSFTCLEVDYAAVLRAPLDVSRELARFLKRPLRIEAMGGVVDPALQRSRSASREAGQGRAS